MSLESLIRANQAVKAFQAAQDNEDPTGSFERNQQRQFIGSLFDNLDQVVDVDSVEQELADSWEYGYRERLEPATVDDLVAQELGEV